MRFRIFISSVQSEFQSVRRELKEFLVNDALLRDFVEHVFVFEDEPAASADPSGVYLGEIDRADIYIGIMGSQYGYQVAEGELSPTEMEYLAAERKGMPRWIYFFDDGGKIAPRMMAFRKRLDAKHKRRRVNSSAELIKQVYATFVQFLREQNLLKTEPFDACIINDATMKEIDHDRIRWFFIKAVEERSFPEKVGSSDMRILLQLNLMRESDGRLLRAALMLFGRNPKRVCFSSMVKCIACAGTEYKRPFVMQVFDGDLFDQVEQAEIFVLQHINRIVGTRDNALAAPLSYDIPPKAIKEAIVNAVAHRDYFSNASVEVRVFADRVEIHNPGALPPGKPLEWLLGPHVSIPANPLIAEAFYQVHFVDRAGSGIADMFDACAEVGLPKPDISVKYGAFVTTLWRKCAPGQKTTLKTRQKTTLKTRQKTTLNGLLPGVTAKRRAVARKVLALMRADPHITYEELMRKLNLSHWTINDYTTLLKENGLIIRRGGDKGGVWEVVEVS